MEKILRLILGYVAVQVKGEQLERFLNLCTGRGIVMEKIRYTGEKQITAVMSVADFFRLRPIRSKTGVHIHVEKKRGMPFFFWKNKKRTAFAAGVFLFFLILFLLSLRIWNIHINGNVKNSTPEILNFLEKQGITHGMAKNKISCSQIATLLRKKYPDIIWVSARIRGTRLILDIQEGIMQKQKTVKEEPCNILADKDGVIVKMISRSGVPLKKVGDTCKKGEVLISGELHILNDSQEIQRNEYVHADGDIYISHNLSYYREFPLQYETLRGTGREKQGFFIKIRSFYLGFYRKTGKDWKKVISEYPLRLTENFVLPISAGSVKLQEMKRVKAEYSPEQAKKIAHSYLRQYEKKLLQKGVQISQNNVTIKTTDSACISTGTLQVIEKTGKESKVRRQEQPNERTAQDG